MTKHALVGFLFLVALIMLGVITMRVTDVKDILGEDPHHLDVEFVGSKRGVDDRLKGGVGGLERGDAVMVSGVQVGRVETVDLNEGMSATGPTFTVFVRIKLKKEIQLRREYSLRITDAGLLGGKQIEIDPGAGPPTTDMPLRGELIPSPLESLGDTVARNAANIDAVFDDVRAITAHIRAGRGTVGQLLMKNTLHERIEKIADRVDTIATSIVEGPGLLPALLSDRELRSNVQGLFQAARGIAERIESGRGSVGRLLQEEGLYNDLRETVASGKRLFADVENGKGVLGVLMADEVVADRLRNFSRALTDRKSTLGRILYDHQMGDDLSGTISDVRSVVGHIYAGRGTIGKLVMDDTIVRRIEGALSAFAGTIEEARESAPANAFLSSLFKWW